MSTMVLPNNYIELEQEEMMYLDGGISLSRARDMVYGAIGTALIAFTGKAIKASVVSLAVQQAGWALTATINSMVFLAAANPALAIVVGSTALLGIYTVGVKAKLW